MFRRILASLILVASALAGCAQQRCSCVSGGYGGSSAAPLPADIQTHRGTLRPDLSALASYEEVDRALNPSGTTPGQYRVLWDSEAQCLAAANSPLARLYHAESVAVMSNLGCHTPAAAPVLSQLMAYRAIDERNKAAGAALELFYSLAEAEANRDILDRGIAEVDRAVAQVDELKQSGLKVPFDRTLMERQKLDWVDKRIQLDAAVSKIQGQLKQTLGIDDEADMPIWPQAELTVTVAAIDIQAAIGDGTAHRADLAAFRMLHASLNADTVPAVRMAMQGVSPGLGTSIAAKRLLGSSAVSEEELSTRQSQVSQAWCELERTIAREIAEGVQNVENRLREIAVAKERCEAWRRRVDFLAGRRESDGVTAFDLHAGRLELLRAESDEIHRVIAWKIAQAKLRQSQGLLAAECGYTLPNTCQ